MAQSSPKAVASSLDKLKLSSTTASSARSDHAEPADSWEDAADEDHVADLSIAIPTPVRPGTSGVPAPPPPTPASPYFYDKSGSPFHPVASGDTFGEASSNTRAGASSERRPEKTTAVASRLIAASLGQKAPKRTEDQRRYDEAIKAQEKKKRGQAREEEERKKREKEQAQKDIWGD